MLKVDFVRFLRLPELFEFPKKYFYHQIGEIRNIILCRNQNWIVFSIRINIQTHEIYCNLAHRIVSISFPKRNMLSKNYFGQSLSFGLTISSRWAASAAGPASRADASSWPSDKNWTVVPVVPMVKELARRSSTHWCLFNISLKGSMLLNHTVYNRN